MLESWTKLSPMTNIFIHNLISRIKHKTKKGGFDRFAENLICNAEKFKNCLKTQWFLDSIESPPITDYQITCSIRFCSHEP